MAADHHILERGFKNISENGKITGFQLLVKSGYYRGIWLCLVDDFVITIDAETFKREQIKFTTPDGAHTYSLDEMAKVTDVRWPWLEPAKLTVSKPGGLKPGVHDVQVVQKDIISYMPVIPSVRTYRKKMTMMA